MDELEILRKARKLIEDPERWTKGQFARDTDGEPLSNGFDSDAVCWCAAGAIEHVSNLDCTVGAAGRATVLLQEAAGGPLASFNDGTEHRRVLELFDKAIKKLERPDG